jgi:Tol biopolymer transport system component
MKVSRGVGRALTGAAVLGAFVSACSGQPGPGERSESAEKTGETSEAVSAFPKATVDAELEQGDWADALTAAQAYLSDAPTDCTANYAALIASTMQVVDSINTYVIPSERNGPPPPAQNQAEGQLYAFRLETALQAATTVASLGVGCEYELAHLPLLVGDASDPIVNGDVRGTWTARTATMLGAIHSAFLYDFEALVSPQPVTFPDGGTTPDLPPLLASMKTFLQVSQGLLFTQPSTPGQLRGGWFDRNLDHIPDAFDELLIDVFVPGTDKRVFDFSQAEFVPGQVLPQEPLVPTFLLPPPRCGYKKFHIDDLVSGANVTPADGLTLSPDGRLAAVPLAVNGKSQIFTMNLDGSNQTCITCGQPGNNDGARWRPTGDAILFVSTRDHANAIGGDGAGIGQELYVMRPDGSRATRLTVSGLWATNYHANWSPDGRHIVWGSTQSRAWDVMVGDFVSDPFFGMRLVNVRRVVHDTTWWETHGFTPDSRSIITTNTRAGFQSTDIYSIDLLTGRRKRLTSNVTWDEHAHLSPDGRELAWISGRWHPAAVSALSDGTLSPIMDFFWIVPGISFEFDSPPAGYTTELTLMDTDGTHVVPLTSDNLVVADNQWSEDGKKIIFRQSNAVTTATTIRILTFDDCR